MVVSSVSRFASQYRPAPLARLPPQLDPNEYQWSPEKRRAEAERVALRSRIKRDFFLRLNDPRRTQLVEDPAIIRWDYARRQNVYPSYRFTPKSSLLSLLWGAGPFVFWYYVLKTTRGLLVCLGCFYQEEHQPKDPAIPEGKTGVIYNVQCKNCNKRYVGENRQKAHRTHP